MVRSPNRVLTPLKSISKINPSKIFVWDGYIFKHFVSSMQPSATSPLFFDNLHFEHFDKSVNHESIQVDTHVASKNCAISEPMWETTFPRNSHAGLGKDFTKI